MAFTTRAEREVNFINSQTLSHVGPGSYKIPSSIDTSSYLKLTSTPFSSTQPRKTFNVGTDETPGPGTYYKEKKIKRRKEFSHVFKSKMKRFDHFNKTYMDLPGPGSYDINDLWNKSKSPTQKTHNNSIMWEKASTAPSIPAPSQSFGYEEGSNGKLIIQGPPYQGHDGTQKDSVGPGEYQVNDKFNERTSKEVSVFKSKSKRDIFASEKNRIHLGPGEYEVEFSEQHLLAHPMSVKKESAVFLSNSSRNNSFLPKEQTPGPGEYDCMISSKPFTGKKPGFGSSTVRPFHSPGRNSINDKSSIPGPGYYEVTVKKESTSPINRKPFSSTTERFEKLRLTENLGPGSYQVDNGFTAEIEAKTKLGNYAVFGSTSRRFTSEKPNAPGPGQYNPEIGEKLKELRKIEKKSSNFASSSKRKLYSFDAEIPAVGQYEVGSKWINKKSVRISQQEVFLSSSPRFKQEPNDLPGPGQYEHEKLQISKNPKPSGSFLTSSSRFAKHLGHLEDTPGPGSYSDSSNSFIKKSFNATI